MTEFTLEDLSGIVGARAGSGDPKSYTAALVSKGVAHCAKKFGEEAIETVIAAVQEDKAAIRAEAADALYHLLVLLHATKVSLADVQQELAERTRQTGLEEKAARSRTA